MLKTPLLFLIFNRPEVTKAVFQEIKKAKPKYLYISADGPRQDKPGEAELCAQARSIVNEIDWDCEIKTLFRDSNLGCKNAVSSGITWFFENVEEGIILEDDTLPSASFFYFCEQLLEKYRHDTRIMHISGENPLDTSFGDASYFFSSIPHIWGWASWRRAWNLYDVNFEKFDYFLENNLIKNVFEQKEAQKYWNRIFKRVKDGEINTWDYQWTYSLFIHNGLSIVPNKNLMSNIGFGVENAAHTSEIATCAERKTFEIEEIIHPSLVMPNKEAIQAILQTRYDIHKKTLPFLIKREAQRAFKKMF